jgi:hypothetical protein
MGVKTEIFDKKRLKEIKTKTAEWEANSYSCQKKLKKKYETLS